MHIHFASGNRVMCRIALKLYKTNSSRIKLSYFTECIKCKCYNGFNSMLLIALYNMYYDCIWRIIMSLCHKKVTIASFYITAMYLYCSGHSSIQLNYSHNDYCHLLYITIKCLHNNPSNNPVWFHHVVGLRISSLGLHKMIFLNAFLKSLLRNV